MVQAVDFPAGRFTITVAPELHAPQGCFTEDGEQIHFDMWVIWATNRAGRRWQFDRAFGPDFKWIDHPHYSGWSITGRLNAEHDAITQAKAFAAALKAGLKLDGAQWQEIDPAYGSEVYQREGIEAERVAAEREEG